MPIEPLFALRGAVQHYGWGGYDFLPTLLNIDNSARRPFAELWIGSHPKAPATALLAEGERPLNELLAEPLPYLLKVLDARQMLSIQAHPDKAQAEAGFARENAAGIPLSAPERNYKDANHKPEVHVAITGFWMLHGFRTLHDIAAQFLLHPELAALGAPTDLRELYTTAMTLPQAQVDAILNPLLARLEWEHPPKDSPAYWALRAARHFPRPDGSRDRGIFSCFLLNLVRLQPGEGTYQPAGVLHAYLEGVNVELMANSDNVLRGGLTPKHVDVPELLRTLSFEGGTPGILAGEDVSATESVYRTPAEEFELSRIAVGPGTPHTAMSQGPEAFITLAGQATLLSGAHTVALARGSIAFVQPAHAYRIEAAGAAAVLYKAALPVRPSSAPPAPARP